MRDSQLKAEQADPLQASLVERTLRDRIRSPSKKTNDPD